MESEKFCLRWNDFEANISGAFNELREEKDFFDVTLACDDQQIQAHKLILSACSPFFRNVLRRNPHQHPLLYLKGVKYRELLSIINFMYLGEVNVAQEELNLFLTVAEDLKVKGLTQGNPGGKNQTSDNNHSGGTTTNTKQTPRQTVPERINASPKVTATPMKQQKLIKSHSTIPTEDQVHVDIPVKIEPQELTQQANYLPYEAQEETDHEGAVVVDESYGVVDSYEQYPEFTMETDGGHRTQGPRQTKTQTKQVLEEKKVKHNFKAFAQAWQCEECKTVFSSRKYAKEHMQEYN